MRRLTGRRLAWAGSWGSSLDVHEHLENPRRWNYGGNERGRGWKTRAEGWTQDRIPPVRSANENHRGTFVFHAGHVDTFLPSRQEWNKTHNPRASATRQFLSRRFRNERFNQLTAWYPGADISPVLFDNLCFLLARPMRHCQNGFRTISGSMSACP